MHSENETEPVSQIFNLSQINILINSVQLTGLALLNLNIYYRSSHVRVSCLI